MQGKGLLREFSFASQNHSRRWRQVGGPRRVSPTVLKAAGPRRTPLLLSIHGTTAEELRPASGRAGAAIGASRASRTPECGTLCCRRREMAALLHAGRSSFSSSFLTREELRVRTIHAAGDKWADRGGSALPPTTDHRPPTTDHRQPTTDNRPPTTDNRQPTTDHGGSALPF